MAVSCNHVEAPKILLLKDANAENVKFPEPVPPLSSWPPSASSLDGTTLSVTMEQLEQMKALMSNAAVLFVHRYVQGRHKDWS